MKTTLSKITLVMLLALVAACRGPEGPPGPQGPAGARGPQGPAAEEAFVIEYEDVDFVAPDYNVFLSLGIEALPSDAVLVYALWDVQTVEGELVDIWRLLPQTTFQEDGLLIYNYEHTLIDVELFLEANFPIADANLGPEVLDDWVIRIVTIPGQYLSNGRSGYKVDISDYEAVKEYYKLPDMPVRKHSYKRSQVQE